MRVLNFRIERNNAVDLINNLKILIKNYDDPNKKCERYLIVPMLENKNFKVNIVIDRKFKAKNNPLPKPLKKHTLSIFNLFFKEKE